MKLKVFFRKRSQGEYDMKCYHCEEIPNCIDLEIRTRSMNNNKQQDKIWFNIR